MATTKKSVKKTVTTKAKAKVTKAKTTKAKVAKTKPKTVKAKVAKTKPKAVTLKVGKAPKKAVAKLRTAKTKAKTRLVTSISTDSGTVNLGDIIAKVSTDCGVSKVDTKKVVNDFVETIKTEVQVGHKVLLSGFGTFEKVGRKSRVGRNPSTGERITIPATRYPRFKPGKTFRSAVSK